MEKKKRIVIALGGNALGNTLPEQMAAVKITARAIVDLIQEGCEPVVPTLMEFILYCAANTGTNGKLYQYHNLKTAMFNLGYDFLHSKQVQMIRCIQKQGVFTPPHDFEDLRKAADKYISQGVSMGEGWMITAEMAVLAETGTENIICTQPFGCLPNHIVAKGMARTIKNAYPNANIVAIDYDPGASEVNQLNRIKLMLSTAQKNLHKGDKKDA